MRDYHVGQFIDFIQGGKVINLPVLVVIKKLSGGHAECPEQPLVTSDILIIFLILVFQIS